MEELLKEKDLKVTPGRLKILEVLSQNNEPKTAETVYKNLDKTYDLVTIYRNLEKFEAKGLIFKESVDKKDYYYLAESRHHHVVCRGCRKMKCVPCSHKKFSVKGFDNIKHQLILTGVCHKCSGS